MEGGQGGGGGVGGVGEGERGGDGDGVPVELCLLVRGCRREGLEME